jgi:hypothetical protein
MEWIFFMLVGLALGYYGVRFLHLTGNPAA